MRWPRHRPDRTARLVALAVALASASCAGPGAPGLGVKALPVDLVFGVPDLRDRPAPANSLPAGALPAPGAVLHLPDFGPRSLPPLPPAPGGSDCPEAGISDFPAEPAARNVGADDRPPLGRYRWKRSGSQKGPHTFLIELPIVGFEEREVRDLREVGEHTFTFDTVQTDVVTGATVITTWQVRTDGARLSPGDAPVSPPPVSGASDDEGPGTPDPASLSAGDPDRGIGIARIRRINDEGRQTLFHPPTPLLLLPLPVRLGEEWQSVASDPRVGQTMTFNGKVEAIERVDACGEVIEGWKVGGVLQVQNDVDPGGEPDDGSPGGTAGSVTTVRDYEAVFAPHLGGLLLQERIEEGETDELFLRATFTIGQLDPDPLEGRAAR